MAGTQGQATTVKGLPWIKFRQASMILPRTGERVKRNFTLRDPNIYGYRNADGPADGLLQDESAPLLPTHSNDADEPISYSQFVSKHTNKFARTVADWIASSSGQGILKCSLAYLLGSLATFVVPIAGLLGQQDGKHTVATITVYFHPARSSGSMHQATLLALLAVAYAAFISFTSMGVSKLFASYDLLGIGHVIVLIVFCGGGLGFVGWCKQSLSHPLVSVSCSLTSLAIITVLTREGAIQDGVFSDDKVMQVLKMVLMGIFITTAVNLLVKPISARRELRESLDKTTDAMGIMLAAITHSFLNGSDEELSHPALKEASGRFKSVFGSLPKHLSEAKYEHFVLGTERQYQIEARLVRCTQQLRQDLGGLRSAAATQASLLSESLSTPAPGASFTPFTPSTPFVLAEGIGNKRTTAEPEELPYGFSSMSGTSDSAASTPNQVMQNRPTPHSVDSNGSISVSSSSQIFSIFLVNLGPPMKSLAFTLKEILDELPIGPVSDDAQSINRTFRQSLVDAIALFSKSRKEALDMVYRSKEISKAQSLEVAADFEEVATSCGYFTSSLQDFAEDTLVYLDILEELSSEVANRPGGRTWKWLHMWKYARRQRPNHLGGLESDAHVPHYDHEESHLRKDMLPLKKFYQYSYEDVAEKSKEALSFRIWRFFSFLRRSDVKFAIKVGAGAAFFAMFSFIPETQPTYAHWRLEWGLLSYMVVCSMTIGASTTTGTSRVLGTCLGAILAIIAWIVSDANPYALATFGALVSLPCFYLIVSRGRAPMGRFILLTYNLSCLYSYSLSVKDEQNDEDEGGINPLIWEIVLHRVVAVLLGCLWGVIITQVIWPMSARKKLKEGLSLLWLRMGLMWKTAPLKLLLATTEPDPYMDLREETRLRQFLTRLETLNVTSSSEFELRGPFPTASYGRLLASTSSMLDSFHALNVLITKDLKASPGEKELLEFTAEETEQLSRRISHLFSVMASSIKLEYSLNDAMPKVDNVRDRLLARIFDFRKKQSASPTAADEDYEILYAFALVTGQISQEITKVSAEIAKLYTVPDDELLKLQ